MTSITLLDGSGRPAVHGAKPVARCPMLAFLACLAASAAGVVCAAQTFDIDVYIKSGLTRQVLGEAEAAYVEHFVAGGSEDILAAPEWSRGNAFLCHVKGVKYGDRIVAHAVGYKVREVRVTSSLLHPQAGGPSAMDILLMPDRSVPGAVQPAASRKEETVELDVYIKGDDGAILGPADGATLRVGDATGWSDYRPKREWSRGDAFLCHVSAEMKDTLTARADGYKEARVKVDDATIEMQSGGYKATTIVLVSTVQPRNTSVTFSISNDIKRQVQAYRNVAEYKAGFRLRSSRGKMVKGDTVRVNFSGLPRNDLLAVNPVKVRIGVIDPGAAEIEVSAGERTGNGYVDLEYGAQNYPYSIASTFKVIRTAPGLSELTIGMAVVSPNGKAFSDLANYWLGVATLRLVPLPY